MFKIDFAKPFIYKDIPSFYVGNSSVNSTSRCCLDFGLDGDLSGFDISVVFKVGSSNVTKIANIVDAKNSIVDIVFPRESLIVGVNELEILCTKEDITFQSPIIKYEVWQGISS